MRILSGDSKHTPLLSLRNLNLKYLENRTSNEQREQDALLVHSKTGFSPSSKPLPILRTRSLAQFTTSAFESSLPKTREEPKLWSGSFVGSTSKWGKKIFLLINISLWNGLEENPWIMHLYSVHSCFKVYFWYSLQWLLMLWKHVCLFSFLEKPYPVVSV